MQNIIYHILYTINLPRHVLLKFLYFLFSTGFWILDQQKTRRMFLFDSGPGQRHLNLPFNQTSEMTEDMKHSHWITSVELPSRCLLSLGIFRFAAAEDNLNVGWLHHNALDCFMKLRYGSELQNFEYWDAWCPPSAKRKLFTTIYSDIQNGNDTFENSFLFVR